LRPTSPTIPHALTFPKISSNTQGLLKRSTQRFSLLLFEPISALMTFPLGGI
jgi:hypothetical protein